MVKTAFFFIVYLFCCVYICLLFLFFSSPHAKLHITKKFFLINLSSPKDHLEVPYLHIYDLSVGLIKWLISLAERLTDKNINAEYSLLLLGLNAYLVLLSERFGIVLVFSLSTYSRISNWNLYNLLCIVLSCIICIKKILAQ